MQTKKLHSTAVTHCRVISAVPRTAGSITAQFPWQPFIRRIFTDQYYTRSNMPTHRAFVDRKDVMYAYVSHSPQKTTYKRLVGGCTPDRVLSWRKAVQHYVAFSRPAAVQHRAAGPTSRKATDIHYEAPSRLRRKLWISVLDGDRQHKDTAKTANRYCIPPIGASRARP